MTVLGALLTALVVAREWEQGTFEALFVTPVRAGEILLCKVIPIPWAWASSGLVLMSSWLPNSFFTFPSRGSLWVLSVSSLLYLLVALGLGLLISSAVKAQFRCCHDNCGGRIRPGADALGIPLCRLHNPAPWLAGFSSYIFSRALLLRHATPDRVARGQCLDNHFAAGQLAMLAGMATPAFRGDSKGISRERLRLR